MSLSIIAAMGENRVIGSHNQLPWHLPADLRHFKQLTIGHTIVMGRKTYESINKPLPQRKNIILTQDKSFQAPGCEILHSVAEIYKLKQSPEEIFIIGGAKIYQLCLPYADRIYLTIIHHAFTGDTFFPEFNNAEWYEESREKHAIDQENKYAYSFIKLTRL